VERERARAAPDAVGEVFQALADTVRRELVAQAPSSFARLGVDSIAGRRLRLAHAGKPLLELIIGRAANTKCLRAPPGRRPCLSLARPPRLRGRPPGGRWRDKRIAALEPDSIAALDVVRGKDRYS